uniref:C-type lectin domain-containing protein n=1 Tax=Oryzias latipes TaxID=8090 RepID=A0A3P9J8P9_ORYLA
MMVCGILCVIQGCREATASIHLSAQLMCMDLSCIYFSVQTCRSFQQGWVYFGSSLYFISSTKLPWLQSRDDCQQRGADLVIINSKEEQVGFVTITLSTQIHMMAFLLLKETMKWNWVDGTLLTERFVYWGQGEPNGHTTRNITCVEIRFFEQENSWNDIRCYEQNFWICEKNAL